MVKTEDNQKYKQKKYGVNRLNNTIVKANITCITEKLRENICNQMVEIITHNISNPLEHVKIKRKISGLMINTKKLCNKFRAIVQKKTKTATEEFNKKRKEYLNCYGTRKQQILKQININRT